MPEIKIPSVNLKEKIRRKIRRVKVNGQVIAEVIYEHR